MDNLWRWEATLCDDSGYEMTKSVVAPDINTACSITKPTHQYKTIIRIKRHEIIDAVQLSHDEIARREIEKLLS